MRPVFSIFAALAVFAVSIEAPFLHTHQHAATQRHPGPYFHFHLKAAPSESRGPAFQGLDPDEDAQYQAWFSETPAHSAAVTVAVPVEALVPPALECAGRVPELPLRVGHDPPVEGPRHPRAPPA